MKILLPAIWLLVLIVGLPQLSETVYTPSLPDIVHDLRTTDAMVEYTLTIYLFGFALGSLFWGRLSDRVGRKPCVIAGLIIFMIGCMGCYFSNTIEALMISRLIQSLGGSIGSVIGQAICRDAFHGPALGKAYASMGSALAVFPALGPVVGGFIAENYGWSNIFIFLIIFAVMVKLASLLFLPETHHPKNRQAVKIVEVIKKMLKDKKLIGYGLLVAGGNGISFSYYAEGPFYLVDMLGISPVTYGLSLVPVAIANVAGGLLSRKLHIHHTSSTILKYGLQIALASSVCFMVAILVSHFIPLSKSCLVYITVVAQMVMMFGNAMILGKALALALVDYKWCTGTASSLFGFFYYIVISLFTFGMGLLHNGTIFPMPLYFLGIAVFMMLTRRYLIKG